MNKKIVLTLAVLATTMVAGCEKPAEAVAHAKEKFAVERLFTHDGCTVYRFRDYNPRYFTRCDGITAQSTTTWQGSCGKNCTRPVEVSGSRP